MESSLPFSPPSSPCWGPCVLSSSLCSSWVPDVLVAGEETVGSRAWPGSGDSLVGEVRPGSQHHWTMKPHPSCLGHCPPSCHYQLSVRAQHRGFKQG